jgi:subtilisin family serine protease
MPDPWHFEELEIPALQEHTRGEGIRVAVLDTGVAQAGGAFAALRSFKADGAASEDVDLDGHGTACASLIASLDAEAPGIAPAVELLSIRVTAGHTPLEEDVRRAFGVALKNRCHVISCSFMLVHAADPTLDAIREAANAGVVVVAAAGNDPTQAADFPEHTPNVLVVGAYGTDRRPRLGRTGPFTDVLAPGEDLPVVLPNGATASFGQTSGAAAVTAGVMALVLSAARQRGPARVGLALEGLARSTALTGAGGRFLVPRALLEAARNL